MDTDLSLAREQDRELQRRPRPWNEHEMGEATRVRTQVRAKGRDKRKQLARWEIGWFETQAKAANEAYETGSLGEMFAIHNKLGVQRNMGRRDGTTISSGNPDASREEWR